MSSTNKTPNYDLSQFTGTDKPAWLNDYNQDMNKIDGGIKNAFDTGNAANGKADANTTAIGDLSYLSTSDKNNLVVATNEVDAKAKTAQGTANNAQTTANNANTNVQALSDYLTFNTFATPTCTGTNINVDASKTSVSCASNSTGSVGKIYGQIRGVLNASSGTIKFQTPLRPSTTITVNGILQTFYSSPDNPSNYLPVTHPMTIAPDGIATITAVDGNTGMNLRYFFYACIIFAKDFGDVPPAP